MVLRRFPFVLAVIAVLPALLAAQPRLERDRSLAEGTRAAERLIDAGEYLLAVEKLNSLVDSAGPGADLSTPLFLLTEANAEVDRNYPALDAARRFLLLYPDDARAGEVHYRRGVTAYREDKREEARESFELITRLKGDREAEAYYWRARLMADVDSMNKAEDFADRSLEEEPHEFTDDALYLSAWIKEGRGEYENASTLYRRLIDEFPESDLGMDAQLRLGVNQARNGYYESALTLFSSLTPRTGRQREELLFYTAEANAALGRHSKAIEVYTEFLREFPTSPRARSARYGLGWSELQTRKYDQALLSFDALTSGVDSLAAAALYQIGAIHTARKDTAAAMAALHELVYRLPYESFSDNAYNQLGRIHYRRANYDSARRYLQIAARQFPESDVRVPAFYLLGESYAALRQFDNAQYSFSRTYKLGDSTDPVVARALYREGVMLYNIGRFNSAINRLRGYVSDYPNGPDIDEASFWLGESLYQDGKFDEAEQFYGIVISDYPNSSYREQAMYGLPWAQFRQQKFNDAVTSFKAYLAAYPEGDDAIEATIRLADAYRFLRKYDLAIETYNSVGGRAGAGERAEEARIRMAEAFVEMGEPERAVEAYRDLERRYTKSPRTDDYAFAVGATYYGAGNDSLAIKELERFLRDYSESENVPRALFMLGDAWYNLGEFETSLGYYRRILSNHPDHPIVPDAIEGLRFALESMGRGPDAVRFIDEFIANNPNRLPADSLTYMKGMIYFDNARFDEAETIFKKLIEQYPESGLKADAWFQIAKGHEYSGNAPEALRIYDLVVREYRVSDAALRSLIDMAALRLRQSDFAGANRDYLLFIERFGESDRINEARYGAGKSYLEIGDTLSAVTQFENVIDSVDVSEVNDVFVDRSRIALAEVLWAQGDAESALEMLASVASRRRDYTAAEALLIRGRILTEVNDLSGALAELRRLTTEFSDYVEYYEPGLLRLGELYELLTNTADAIATYQQLADVTQDEELKAEAEARIARLKKRR